jgi:hypothetical protein
MMKKNILLIFVLFLIVTGCADVKDALSGKKSENSDEFLVIKKNPLTLPPDFNELPEPRDKTKEEESTQESNDIEKLLTGVNTDNCIKENNCKKKKSVKTKSIEEFVLKKINED